MLTENCFDSDGIRLHYIDYGGDGPPLVLFAGLGGTAQLFRGLGPERLEAVVYLDTSNHTIFVAKEDETVEAIVDFLG